MAWATLPMVGFFMLFGLMPLPTFGTLAQPNQAADEYVLQVNATSSPALRDALGALPDDTIAVSVADADTGADYGRCTLSFSKAPGGCVFFVAPGSTVIATLDATTLPAGVGVAANPLTYDVPLQKTQLGDISFDLVLTGDPTATTAADAWAAWLSAADRMVETLRP